jgi:hypothetical protein
MGRGTAELVVTVRLSVDDRMGGVLEANGYMAPGQEPRIDLIVKDSLMFWGLECDWKSMSVVEEGGTDGRVVKETLSRSCVVPTFFPSSFFFFSLPF